MESRRWRRGETSALSGYSSSRLAGSSLYSAGSPATSWNSTRWNKPSTASMGYTSYQSETTKPTTYSSAATRNYSSMLNEDRRSRRDYGSAATTSSWRTSSTEKACIRNNYTPGVSSYSSNLASSRVGGERNSYLTSSSRFGDSSPKYSRRLTSSYSPAVRGETGRSTSGGRAANRRASIEHISAGNDLLSAAVSALKETANGLSSRREVSNNTTYGKDYSTSYSSSRPSLRLPPATPSRSWPASRSSSSYRPDTTNTHSYTHNNSYSNYNTTVSTPTANKYSADNYRWSSSMLGNNDNKWSRYSSGYVATPRDTFATKAVENYANTPSASLYSSHVEGTSTRGAKFYETTTYSHIPHRTTPTATPTNTYTATTTKKTTVGNTPTTTTIPPVKRRSRFLRQKKSDDYDSSTDSEKEGNTTNRITKNRRKNFGKKKNSTEGFQRTSSTVRNDASGSSSDDNPPQNSLEFRIKARRRRLQKSKALLRDLDAPKTTYEEQTFETVNRPYFDNMGTQPQFNVQKVYIEPLKPIPLIEVLPSKEKLAPPRPFPPTGPSVSTPNHVMAAQLALTLENAARLKKGVSETALDRKTAEASHFPGRSNDPHKSSRDSFAKNATMGSSRIDFSSFEALENSWKSAGAESGGGREAEGEGGESSPNVEEPEFPGTRVLIDAFNHLDRSFKSEKKLAPPRQMSQTGSITILNRIEESNKPVVTKSPAKKLVLLHSDERETTVLEKQSSIPSSAVRRRTEKPVASSETNVSLKKDTSKEKLHETVLFAASVKDKGLSLQSTTAHLHKAPSTPLRSPITTPLGSKSKTTRDNPDRDSPYAEARQKLAHIDRDLLQLLTLGDEVSTPGQPELNKSSDDEFQDAGFKTPPRFKTPPPIAFMPKPLNSLNRPASFRGSMESMATSVCTFKTPPSTVDNMSTTDRPMGGSYHQLFNNDELPNNDTNSIRKGMYNSQNSLRRAGSAASGDSWASAKTGRQSSLDVASDKVEEMLRRAKNKQQERKNRLKEALTNLDEIYEDIKKECNDLSAAKPPVPYERNWKQTSTYNLAVDKKHDTSHYRSVPHIIAAPPSHIDSKWDFTQKWLQNDLHALTQIPPHPKPDLLQFGPREADLRSVGSASAEVDCIFNRESGSSQGRVPDLVPQKHQAIIKPSPICYASYQDLQKPQVPTRKDSLSSVDSARVRLEGALGRDMVKNAPAPPPRHSSHTQYQSWDNNLRPSWRQQPISDRQSGPENADNSDTGSGYGGKAPPMTQHMANFIKRFQSYDFLPPGSVKHSDEDSASVGHGVTVTRPRYAESTHSLPVNPKKAVVMPKPSLARIKDSRGSINNGQITPLQMPSTSTLTDVEATPKAPRKVRNFAPLREFMQLDTVDSLVAELELNVDVNENEQRKFPTGDTEDNPNNHYFANSTDNISLGYPKQNRSAPFAPETRNNNYPSSVASSSKPSTVNFLPYKTQKALAETSNTGLRSPFLLINEENLMDKKVESMKNVFEPVPEESFSPTLPELSIFKKQLPPPSAHRPIALQPLLTTVPNTTQLLNINTEDVEYSEINSLQRGGVGEMWKVPEKQPLVSAPHPPPAPPPTRPPLTIQTNGFHMTENDKEKEDDDYDNIPPVGAWTGGQFKKMLSPRRHNIKIADVVLGQDSVRHTTNEGSNPLKNLIKRLKAPPPSALRTPRTPTMKMSTISLNEIHSFPHHVLHKSNSSGENPMSTSMTSEYTADGAFSTKPQGSEKQGPLKFLSWTPWKKNQ